MWNMALFLALLIPVRATATADEIDAHLFQIYQQEAERDCALPRAPLGQRAYRCSPASNAAGNRFCSGGWGQLA
jgi:hypothetical protein